MKYKKLVTQEEIEAYIEQQECDVDFDADEMIQECIEQVMKIKSRNPCNETVLGDISTSEHLEQMFTESHKSEKK